MLTGEISNINVLNGDIQKDVISFLKEEEQIDICPSIYEKEYTPQNNKVFSKVLVKGVTSDIDKNIKPENIKLGVSILGVEGSADVKQQGSGGKYLVQVIDYDGTVLKEDHLNTGATFTLPNTPTNHERLVFQEWSSPVDIIDNTVTVEDQDITIGAVYTTKSGLSEFDITLTKVTGLSVTLRLDGTKDWGDGTIDTSISHTYSNYGDYMITCDGTTMSGKMFNQKSQGNYFCKSIRLTNVSNIYNGAFQYCRSLKNITISKNTTSIDRYAFGDCYLLKCVIIPSSVTSMTFYYSFNYCYNLEKIILPKLNNVTSIGDYSFSYCYSLVSLTIPNNITNIGNYAFTSCYKLKNIIVPLDLTVINDGTFRYCYSITKYDFTKYTTIPTLAYTGAFNEINALCKIYVPDELYDEWTVATNWVTYANYIYKASEMEE